MGLFQWGTVKSYRKTESERRRRAAKGRGSDSNPGVQHRVPALPSELNQHSRIRDMALQCVNGAVS